MRVLARVVAGGCVFVALSAQTAFSPARYRSGGVPVLPAVSVAVGGGQVLLEVTISASGEVSAITPLRTTASFTEPTAAAVRGWRFAPAETRIAGASGSAPPKVERAPSKVLVAALFRPPTLHSPTLGEEIRDVARGSGETPFPVSIVMPPFPPRARDAGVVLVEVDVAASGAVMNVRVVRPAPPFDDAARDAARQWTFRPARIAGRPVRSFVYILFGFASPQA
jgi:TonB family protein